VVVGIERAAEDRVYGRFAVRWFSVIRIGGKRFDRIKQRGDVGESVILSSSPERVNCAFAFPPFANFARQY
jgi:hypothetical protein